MTVAVVASWVLWGVMVGLNVLIEVRRHRPATRSGVARLADRAVYLGIAGAFGALATIETTGLLVGLFAFWAVFPWVVLLTAVRGARKRRNAIAQANGSIS